ncbi:hypothetical protein [Streptacidiphilus monticola]|uniref:Uncharacterized protein n=1 Tax=Streptacidiphilus monticola TaxID=2161674 RepID=A0ABW1GCQ1_9ACTN
MSADATTRLLELASHAVDLTDPTRLRALLAEGHPLYCQALADVRTHLLAQAAHLTDEELAARCTHAGSAWEPGTSREDALIDLLFAVFESTPACIAYVALAERAHQHHTGLID